MDYDDELDCSGLVCPMPALKTKKQLNKMEPGKILRVFIDYEPATESVPRDLAKTTKHEFLGSEEADEEDGWYLYFKCVK